jgi:hypothetical protein
MISMPPNLKALSNICLVKNFAVIFRRRFSSVAFDVTYTQFSPTFQVVQIVAVFFHRQHKKLKRVTTIL